MWTGLLDDAEGKHAGALRLVDSLHEVGSGQLFPFCGKARLRNCVARKEEHKESNDEHTANSLHCSPRIFKTGDCNSRNACTSHSRTEMQSKNVAYRDWFWETT